MESDKYSCSSAASLVVGQSLPRTRSASGVKGMVFVDQKNNLNRTLVIDSPFQTFAVGRVVELIETSSTTAFSHGILNCDLETLSTLSWSRPEVKVQHTSK